MKHLSIPEGSHPREIWARVIVPAIRDKYQSMKCNTNNKIKSIYMSMRIVFEYATQYLLMQRPHNKIIATVYISTGDIRLVEPDPLSEGFSRYATCNMEHYVFEFLLNYVRRMISDLNWSKLLKKNQERLFLLFITPSDIAYVLAFIKNGMAIWDQAKRLQENPSHGEKKAVPLFTKGKNLKRESGKTVCSKDGLNYYYTAEKNWKKVYNDKDECNKWEQWGPEDKSWKNPIRTYWRENEVEQHDIREEDAVDEGGRQKI
jgi:hypothetical protein